jgi:carbon storage regulator
MLVLSRKIEESVVVGDGCKRLLKVTVLEIRNGAVKLGIEAEDDIPVHRAEVWDRITAENWGGTDREIPQSAMSEALLHRLRKHNNLSATAEKQNVKQTQLGKRST